MAITVMPQLQFCFNLLDNAVSNINGDLTKRTSVIGFCDQVASNHQTGESGQSPRSMAIGSTPFVQTYHQTFAAGEPTLGGPLDVFIREPHVFLAVLDHTGAERYVRQGQFSINKEGKVVLLGSNIPLEGLKTIPPHTTDLRFDSQGNLTGQEPGQNTRTDFGCLKYAVFPNPGGLQRQANGTFHVTEGSGPPQSLEADFDRVLPEHYATLPEDPLQYLAINKHVSHIQAILGVHQLGQKIHADMIKALDAS